MSAIISTFAPVLTVIGIILAIAIGVTIIVKTMYKQARVNQAMIVTGPKGSKTFIGRGKFVIPLIQRVDYLSLENIQSDFTSRDDIPTKDAINIVVDAVANVSISKDPEVLDIAAGKFLGKGPDYIRTTITPVLEGNIREIISQTTLKDLIQGDKKAFAEKVMENVAPNLRDMGLELTTFNIQNFKDRSGVIENLGMENIVQISKDAAISKANAEKEIAVAQAEAAKEANAAKIASDTEIAKRNNELAIQKAELKKAADIKKAEADAAYNIQQEEQRKTIEITTANANLARQEKEIELRAREVEIKEKSLEAEVKKTAEAKKYAEQQAADARLYAIQRQSEAELFERQKKAEAEKFEAEQAAEATKAESEAARVAMENEAAGIKAKGEAEAAAIQAKAEAEAAGILKKAEAMKNFQDAAKQEMQLSALKYYFEQLPAIAEATGKAYTNVDKIVMFGGESSKLTEDVITNITKISEGLSESMGIDLKTMFSSFLGSNFAHSTKNIGQEN